MSHPFRSARSCRAGKGGVTAKSARFASYLHSQNFLRPFDRSDVFRPRRIGEKLQVIDFIMLFILVWAGQAQIPMTGKAPGGSAIPPGKALAACQGGVDGPRERAGGRLGRVGWQDWISATRAPRAPNMLLCNTKIHQRPSEFHCCTFATYGGRTVLISVIYLLLTKASPMITPSLPGSAQGRRPKLKAIPN